MEPHALRGRVWAAMGGVLLAAVILLGAGVPPLVIATPLDSTQAASQESNTGDLIAGSLRDKGQAQIAILPANELRPVVIAAGHIDPAVLVSVLRSASDDTDTVVVLHLTGTQIRKALLHGLSRLPGPYAGFLQVSGLKVVYDSSGHAPTISSLTLSASGESIADSHSYTVATSRLLADGALGYFDIWGKSDIANDTGISISTALSDYASTHQPVDYRVDGRITAR